MKRKSIVFAGPMDIESTGDSAHHRRSIMTQVHEMIQAHSWVKIIPREFMPRGDVHLGSSSTIVDSLHMPQIEATFVLAFENSWGTRGGIKQDAVLYAYDHSNSSRKVVDRHTIFNGRDLMSGFYPVEIAISVCFETEDALRKGERTYRRSSRAYASGVCMAEKGRGGCSVVGVYAITSLTRVTGWTCAWDERKIIRSQTWTTGKVEPDVLTKKNIARFYRKYMKSIPAVPEEIGAG